jgi:hypothetical protein
MLPRSARLRRRFVFAMGGLALIVCSGASVVLAGTRQTTPSAPAVPTASAAVAATASPVAGTADPFDAAVQALVDDGTIDRQQADALDQRIAAGFIDPGEVVASGVLTAAQMEVVEARLDAVKRSLAPGPDSPQPAGSDAAEKASRRDAGGQSAADADANEAAARAAFDAALQSLVDDGTIDQHQGDVLRQHLDAGTIDPDALVAAGAVTADQMQAVLDRLGTVKRSFAPPSGAAPSGDPSTKKAAQPSPSQAD